MIFSCSEDKPSSKEVYNSDLSTEEIFNKGAALFKTNCQFCHSLDQNKPSIMAPVLEKIEKNWPDEEVLARYILNAPEQMQKSERARAIYKDWKNKTQMPAFTALSRAEVDCIIKYLYKKAS